MSIPLQKAGAVQTFTHTIDRYVVRELALMLLRMRQRARMFVFGVRAAEIYLGTFVQIGTLWRCERWLVCTVRGGLVCAFSVPLLVIDSEKRLKFDSPCVPSYQSFKLQLKHHQWYGMV